MLCYAYFASQTSGLCSAFFFPRFPCKVCTLMFMLCYTYFASQTSGLCSAFPSVPFWVCTLMWLAFCYAYFASQTSGLCSACTSVPFGILHACVFMFCVLRLANTRFVQYFSLGSLLGLYAYVSRFLMRSLPYKLRVCAVLAPRFPLEFCTRVFLCFAWFASPNMNVLIWTCRIPLHETRLVRSAKMQIISPFTLCRVNLTILPSSWIPTPSDIAVTLLYMEQATLPLHHWSCLQIAKPRCHAYRKD